ncbi:MAG: epoxide hydrolase [Gammaproteobacteria bacterium]|nr:epoxide hydrolase [Gammaproteobacteria bacterium]
MPNRYPIRIHDQTLVDLKARLARTRWPDQIEGVGWEAGTDGSYLRSLCEYWREEFDWSAQERRLNDLPHFRTDVNGLGIHFVHVRGRSGDPLPLIITHGWPSTFFEVLKLVPLLTDPGATGGSEDDSFDVVIPSLPGFGFSDRPRDRFVSGRVPELWVELMRQLGYERFGAHGGDLGGGVSARLGQRHGDKVVGIHVTNVYGSIAEGDRPATDAEVLYLEQQQRWEREEGAYEHLQSTRPQTAAFGLNDSPAGLAAWIVEKYRAWSDCDGDIEGAFTKDELLTNITIYWATQTVASSFRPYWDFNNNPHPAPWTPIRVPCGIAVFPKDLGRPPREFAERSYNVQRWTEMPRGGHFAALEEPDMLAADIRAFFRELRD